MNVLWMGNEDLEFLTLGSANVDTNSAHFRSGWSRCAIQAQYFGSDTFYARSYPFPGGTVTSAWLSFQALTSGVTTSTSIIGLGLSGTPYWIGLETSASNASKLTLVTYNGVSTTVLASEGGTSFGGVIQKFDMQVLNFGASATVNVYVNNGLIISYSGSTTISGMTNFDSVFIPNFLTGGGAGNFVDFSEFIVADSDTRALLGLNTLALTGAGSTTSWTNNTYTNINGINYSDLNPTYTNSTAQDQEYTVGTVQPTVCAVVAVGISARMAATAGSTPTHVKLGYGSGGTGHFGSGAQKTPTVAFGNFLQIDQTNPITSAAWTQGDLTAPLQLDIQSA